MTKLMQKLGEGVKDKWAFFATIGPVLLVTSLALAILKGFTGSIPFCLITILGTVCSLRYYLAGALGNCALFIFLIGYGLTKGTLTNHPGDLVAYISVMVSLIVLALSAKETRKFFQDVNSELSVLQRDLQDKNKELETLKKDLTDLSQNFDNLSSEKIRLDEDLAAYKKLLAVHEHEIGKIKQQNQKLMCDSLSKGRKAASLQIYNNNLKKEFEDLSNSFTPLESAEICDEKISENGPDSEQIEAKNRVSIEKAKKDILLLLKIAKEIPSGKKDLHEKLKKQFEKKTKHPNINLEDIDNLPEEAVEDTSILLKELLNQLLVKVKKPSRIV